MFVLSPQKKLSKKKTLKIQFFFMYLSNTLSVLNFFFSLLHNKDQTILEKLCIMIFYINNEYKDLSSLFIL
jgi:hypothetical protein